MSYRHGTYSGYARNGCRCEKCCEYQRSSVARNRADRQLSGRLNHGTRSAYDTGCRCTPCRDSRSEAYRRLGSELPRVPRAPVAEAVSRG